LARSIRAARIKNPQTKQIRIPNIPPSPGYGVVGEIRNKHEIPNLNVSKRLLATFGLDFGHSDLFRISSRIPDFSSIRLRCAIL
jgi:hypothetical protein